MKKLKKNLVFIADEELFSPHEAEWRRTARVELLANIEGSSSALRRALHRKDKWLANTPKASLKGYYCFQVTKLNVPKSSVF